MKQYEKYTPQTRRPELSDRRWPDGRITSPPVWCSVDLRDGNQALIEPMNVDEKLHMFRELVRIGFKEIETGFPSSSDTEFAFTRELIDGHYIPDDVSIQVLVQAREHLIRRTFESIAGAKNVIVHMYNATSEPYRRLVFAKSREEVLSMAVEGAKLVYDLTLQHIKNYPDTNIRYEYSPEFFPATEPEYAVEICAAVMEALHATPEHPVIINLPTSVQLDSPNVFADQVEYFCRNIPDRDSAIISVHTHNDRGCGVAECELALMAGAQRVEGTLFGNGERTGNCDVVTVALNMFSHGIDPGLELSDLSHIRRIYEQCTRQHIYERQPYSGDLVFTSFSGSHQDAINKGIEAYDKGRSDCWEVPYLPICPADVGRQYEPVIRINSQSGKGGAAFVLHHSYGYMLPRGMHPEFGMMVKQLADSTASELTAEQIMALFEREYINISSPYELVLHAINDAGTGAGMRTSTRFAGSIVCHGEHMNIDGSGNGPIDAFFDGLKKAGIDGYRFVNYSEHAVGEGSDAQAVAYIELRTADNRNVFGVGVDPNINLASIKGVLCAINRAVRSIS